MLATARPGGSANRWLAAVVAAQRRLADPSSTPWLGVQLGSAEHAMFVQWRLRRDDRIVLYPRSFLRHRDWLAPDGPGIGR